MSRRTSPPRPAGSSQGRDGDSAAPKAASPFAALRKQLQQRTQPAPAPAPSPSKRIRPPLEEDAGPGGNEHAQEPDAAELELFRRSVGDVRPVRGTDRVEIVGPRPAPVPRAQVESAEEVEAPSRTHIETDPLRTAYAGVVPLRDTGRIALDTPLRHHARHTGGTHPAPALRPDAIVLPADADVADPAALFRAVVGNARPVADRNRVELDRPQPAPAPLKREEDERAALDESLAAPLTFEDRLDMGDEAAFLRTGLPRRVLTDLRRGRWVLQDQIDLHGLTRDEARAALADFLHDALAQGKRCIRVIHGKGHGSPGKVSILKQLSRGWLAQREEILAFCQAGPHDGGGGALLVLLRAQNAAPRA
ncbi:MAG: Smr/MutS family protein [Thauera sp.]|nr:Smr/MutS family protein [Thauera sp.]